MKNKVILATFLFLASALGVSAQQESFQKGSAVMDLSIGTPTNSGCDYREVMMPPVTLTFDFGGPSGFIKKRSERGKKSSKSAKSSANGKGAFGFGGIVGFYQDDCWGWDCNHAHHDHYYYGYGCNPYDATVSNVVTAFRFSFHFQPVKNMDTYIGLLTGGRFRIWSYEENPYVSHSGSDPVGHEFCFGPFTGMRYYFGDIFGLKAEFSVDTGSGFPNASAGCCFRLK